MKKIFFGTNLGSDKSVYDSDMLISKKVDDDQKVNVGKSKAFKDSIVESRAVPVGFVLFAVFYVGVILNLVSLLVFMLITILLAGLEVLKPVEDILAQQPWIGQLVSGVYIVLMFFIALLIVAPRSLRPAKFRAERAELAGKIAEIRGVSKKMLEIPDDAQQIDIFSCAYEYADGKLVIDKFGRTYPEGYISRLERCGAGKLVGRSRKRRTRMRLRYLSDESVTIPFRKVSFNNIDCWIYKEDDRVYIADAVRKMSVPCGSFTGIRKVKGRTLFTGWNKAEKHNRGEYRTYGIKKLSVLDDYRVWNYYALCFTARGNDFELYFPAYELAVIEEMTGLRADM